MLIRKLGYLLCILFASSMSIAAEIIEINFAYVGESEHPALLGVKHFRY